MTNMIIPYTGNKPVSKGTSAQWTASRSIIPLDVVCFETDTDRYKIGTGELTFNELPYESLVVIPSPEANKVLGWKASGELVNIEQVSGITTITDTTINEFVLGRNSTPGTIQITIEQGNPVDITDEVSAIVIGEDPPNIYLPRPESSLTIDPLSETESSLWSTGVHFTNGLFVGIPDNSDQFIVIDQDANTVELKTLGLNFSGIDLYKSCAQVGQRLIAAPYNAEDVLIVNYNETTKTLTASKATFNLALSGTGKWKSTVYVDDTCIYFIPYNAVSVVKLNPSTMTAVRETYSGILTGTSKWSDGIYVNGKVYCIPYNASSVLIIDHATNTAILDNFDLDLSGNAKWSGATLGVDGKIYCAPYNSSKVLIIDPVTNTASLTDFTLDLSGTAKYKGIIAGEDNSLYCSPISSSDILMIHTPSSTASFVNISTIANKSGWWSGTVASEGYNYYFTVKQHPPILANASSAVTEGWVGATTDKDGNIFIIPHNSKSLQVFNDLTGQKIDINYGDEVELDPSIFDPSNASDPSSLVRWDGGTRFNEWASSAEVSSGIIYAIPYNSNKILSIDTRTGITDLNNYGLDLGGINKWRGCVSVGQRVFAAPFNASNSLVITYDPINQSTSVLQASMGISITGTGKWSDVTYVDENCLYYIPFNASSAVKVNPSTMIAEVKNFDGILSGSSKWSGGVYAYGKIYCIPYDASDILVIDVSTETASRNTFGLNLAGTAKWSGGVLGNDGKIYCSPYDATDVLIIDPITNTAVRETFGLDLNGSAKWHGCLITKNGNVLCPSYTHEKVLTIIPGTNKASLEHPKYTNNNGEFWSGLLSINNETNYINVSSSQAGASLPGQDIANVLTANLMASSWMTSVRVASGMIYCIPYTANNIISINPSTGVAKLDTFGASIYGPNKWRGAVAVGNQVFAAPFDASNSLVITHNAPLNASSASTESLGINLSGTGKWSDAIYANGHVYYIPYNADFIAKVNPSTMQATLETFGTPLGGYAKWSSAIYTNGKIYCIPYSSTDVLIIDPITNTAVRKDYGVNLVGLSKWNSAVLGKDNKIYCIPHDATDILIIDPVTDTAVRKDFNLTLTGQDKWYRGALGDDGRIYCAPRGQSNFLIIDTDTQTLSTESPATVPKGENWWTGFIMIGSHSYYIFTILKDNSEDLAILTDTREGSRTAGKWAGAVYLPAGNIVAIPFNFSYPLIINQDQQATINRSVYLKGSKKWYGGAIGPDGKAYGIPYNANDIFVYDNEVGTSQRKSYGLNLNGLGKWAGCVHAMNGRIYAVPYNANDILVIDPNQDQAYKSTMSLTLSGYSKWVSGVLGPDGKIYCAPFDATSILIIDPTNETAMLKTYGLNLTGSGKYHGGALHTDGRIYFAPYNANKVLVVDAFSDTAFFVYNSALTAETKSYSGMILGMTGSLYAIPTWNKGIVKITPRLAQPVSTMLTISPYFNKSI